MFRKLSFYSLVLVASGVLVVSTQLGGQQQRPTYPKPQIEKLESAPDFTLRDQDGQPFKLSEQRRPVLLYFYRGYW